MTGFFAATAAPACAPPAVSFVDPAFGLNALGTNPGLVEWRASRTKDVRGGPDSTSSLDPHRRIPPMTTRSSKRSSSPQEAQTVLERSFLPQRWATRSMSARRSLAR